MEFNLTENEIKMLKELSVVTHSDDNKLNTACKINEKNIGKILNHLKNLGLVTGAKADNRGWIMVKITALGKEYVRKMNKPWYQKIPWLKILPIIIALATLMLGILNWWL